MIKNLSTYDLNVFIPFIKGQINALLELFQMVTQDINKRQKENDPALAETIKSISLEKPTENIISEFYGHIEKVCSSMYIEPLLEMKNKIESIKLSGDFRDLLNQLNHKCVVLMNLENEIFYYRFQTIPIIRSNNGKTEISNQNKIDLTTLTLQTFISNIKIIAETTNGSIKNWAETKGQEIDRNGKLKSQRFSIYINILLIFSALASSFLFIKFSDYYEMYKLKYQLKEATEKLQELENINRINKSSSLKPPCTN